MAISSGPGLGQLPAGSLYFLHLGEARSQTKRHLKRPFAILILNSRARGLGFYFLRISHLGRETLASFGAYGAAKLSAGFISKQKEAAKIAKLML